MRSFRQKEMVVHHVITVRNGLGFRVLVAGSCVGRVAPTGVFGQDRTDRSCGKKGSEGMIWTCSVRCDIGFRTLTRSLEVTHDIAFSKTL